jgi:O-antigen/teichoic acid export membrane protein
MLDLSYAFLAAGFLFAFPSTLYTPFVIYFYHKNNHGLLSRCAIGSAIAMLASCSFFIQNFGLIGGLYCCILGQWIFMFLVTIFYEQDQLSRKIKLIK